MHDYHGTKQAIPQERYCLQKRLLALIQDPRAVRCRAAAGRTRDQVDLHNSTYAIAVASDVAQKLGVSSTLSDYTKLANSDPTQASICVNTECGLSWKVPAD
jgi:hypothetical protein